MPQSSSTAQMSCRLCSRVMRGEIRYEERDVEGDRDRNHFVTRLPSQDPLRIPMLMAASSKGIKKTGLVYSPGKSWAAGLLLVAFAVVIFSITILTTFVH